MAGLLTYSLKGAFPFYTPKPLKTELVNFILTDSGYPPTLSRRWVTVAKSALKYMEITAAGTVAELPENIRITAFPFKLIVLLERYAPFVPQVYCKKSKGQNIISGKHPLFLNIGKIKIILLVLLLRSFVKSLQHSFSILI
jgi:hypothetical protein